MNNMSYICEFCGLRPESCACSVDVTEPRLETELTVADNIMAVENQKPYGLLDAPCPSDFFSLLVELEKEKDELEIGPLPKFTRQTNMPPGINFPDEPLICDGPILTTPIKIKLEGLPIPKLERQTNMPPGISFSDEDLQEITIDLFPQEDDELPAIDYCETCCNFLCECDKMVSCQCGALYHMDEPYKMCFTCEMAQRCQDSIDQELYPDDIRERYDSH
jgi:hypothetical protein